MSKLDIFEKVGVFNISANVISISFDSESTNKSLMVITDSEPTIWSINTNQITNLLLSRKYIKYSDSNHFDSSAQVVSNNHLVITHMHDEEAHYIMRVFKKNNCYASAPLVDIPLNYSSRNVPYIAALDPNWDIFLI
jgi:glyceraldehyde-3-phosphate dehydrogenase/erythrose-4-phosphate dehydrogenase